MHSSLNSIEQMTKETIRARMNEARPVSILFLFTNGGSFLGTYKSSKRERKGDTWGLTQGEIESFDLITHFHPAAIAARRELKEELHIELAHDAFTYIGSLLGLKNNKCSTSDPRQKADYHMVVAHTRVRNVITKVNEVAKFSWIDVGTCLSMLNPPGEFMSEQKTAIVKAGLAEAARHSKDAYRYPKLAEQIGHTVWARELRGESVAA